MTSRELLSALLTAMDTPYSTSFVQGEVDLWPTIVREALLSAAVLRRDRNRDFIECHSCGDSHAVHLLRARATLPPRYIYDCPEEGRQWLSPSDLHTWTLDPAALARWLAQQMPTGEPAEVVIDGRFWRIGNVRAGVPVYLARGLAWQDADVVFSTKLPFYCAVLTVSAVTTHSSIRPTLVSEVRSFIRIDSELITLDYAALVNSYSPGEQVDAVPEVPNLEFTLSSDSRSVKRRETLYPLTRLQGKVIRVLHNAYKAGTPDVEWAAIQTAIGTTQERLRDIFRGMRDWRDLITDGHSKGTYRLNIK